MSELPFIGRQSELAMLRRLHETKIANLVVINGRRRIGKSRLVKEFAKDSVFYQFSGLPPTTGINAQMQRDAFVQRMQHYHIDCQMTQHWDNLFTTLAQHVRSQRCVILLDEISWMAHDDPSFLGIYSLQQVLSDALVSVLP